MKTIGNMSLGELAAYICSYLKEYNIDCVLSGGACVSIYSKNKYQSKDLDFIEDRSVSIKHINNALSKLGFVKENGYFKHKDIDYFIEFPAGPLSIGSQPVTQIKTLHFSTGQLRIISPTDCVKDRLAAYYHWDDNQSLEQALLVAKYNKINLKEIQQWSELENKRPLYEKIRDRFLRLRRKKSKF